MYIFSYIDWIRSETDDIVTFERCNFCLFNSVKLKTLLNVFAVYFFAVHAMLYNTRLWINSRAFPFSGSFPCTVVKLVWWLSTENIACLFFDMATHFKTKSVFRCTFARAQECHVG